MKRARLAILAAICFCVSGCVAMDGGRPAPSVDVADGDSMLRRFQYDRAIFLFTRALESGLLGQTELLDVHGKRAQAYYLNALVSAGDKDSDLLAALKDFSYVRTELPNSAAALNGEGTVLAGLGAYAEALASFKAAYAAEQPQPYWSLIGIGATFRLMGDYESALRYYNRLFQVAGSASGMPIFYHRGLTFFALGRYRDAIESLDAGVPQQREYAWAYVYRACSQARINEFDKAVADYDAAIEFHKRDRAQYGGAIIWQRIMDRLTAERASVSAMAKGAAGAIAVSMLCEVDYPRIEGKRERSPLLPPADANEKIPDLGILPPGDDPAGI
jgi:tetratricopeptide (TPR) repeat protein